MSLKHERTRHSNRLDINTRFFEATLYTRPAGWEEESSMTLSLSFGPPAFYMDHRFHLSTSWFVPTFMFRDVKPKEYGPYVRDLIETMGANEAWNHLHPEERPLPNEGDQQRGVQGDHMSEGLGGMLDYIDKIEKANFEGRDREIDTLVENAVKTLTDAGIKPRPKKLRKQIKKRLGK